MNTIRVNIKVDIFFGGSSCMKARVIPCKTSKACKRKRRKTVDCDVSNHTGSPFFLLFLYINPLTPVHLSLNPNSPHFPRLLFLFLFLFLRLFSGDARCAAFPDVNGGRRPPGAHSHHHLPAGHRRH